MGGFSANLGCRVNSAKTSNPRYQFAVLHPPKQGKSKAWDSMMTSLDLVASFSLGVCHLLSGKQRPSILRCVCRGVRYGPRGIFALEAVAAILVGVAFPPELVIDGNNSYQGAAKARDFSPRQRGAPCRQDRVGERQPSIQ